MRSPAEVQALEKELATLADFGERRGLPGSLLTQAQAMRKVTEALRWVLGENNGLASVVREIAEIDRQGRTFDA